ncbi:MAG: FkbM family methyltransferase [Nitrospirae bacterium]|nr:FkbM family methyltransferase [Nitrospirota bacterium]
MKLKIYSDRSFLPPGMPHAHMLYPFWGKNPEDPGDPDSGRFDRYAQSGKGSLDMVALKESVAAVYPADWIHTIGNPAMRESAKRFAAQAADAGRPVVVFFWADSNQRIPLENTVVFRSTLHRSTRDPNEFMMPEFSHDFARLYCGGNLPLRSKRPKPVVGFAGFPGRVRPTVRELVRIVVRTGGGIPWVRRRLQRRLAGISGHVVRARALRNLSRSAAVATQFVLRDSFLAGALRPDGTVDRARREKTRAEFARNLVESDYVLCTQGCYAGGGSYRFSEALSCGRIPVMVDTDTVLPYDFHVGRDEWNIRGRDHDGRPTPREVEVAATSLDTYFPSGSTVNLVKLDVEGAEALVLAGMRRLLREARPVVIVEFHDREGWEGRKELLEAGYDLYDMNGAKLDPVRDTERLYHVLALPGCFPS